MNGNRHTGFFATLATVMRKELRDFARDRKTFLLTLLLGPLFYPILMLGMGKLTEMRLHTQLEKPMEIAIVGAERAPNLVAHLASQGIGAMKTPRNALTRAAPMVRALASLARSPARGVMAPAREP